MSRAYNARRKAKRQAQAAAERGLPRRRRPSLPRLTALVPVLLIAAIFAIVGVLGFGASSGLSKKQVNQEVTELLNGIPQNGAVLGSPKAPLTVWLYGDVQCPTVKLFVASYLPSFVDTSVRTGAVKLEYRPFQTDTENERTFFRQEMAGLAAGRQDKMWNFILTFIYQQGEESTEYATGEFVSGIALQVSDLAKAQWRRDREDARLSRRVASAVHSGHVEGVFATPSFRIGFTSRKADQSAAFGDLSSLKQKVEFSLRADINALLAETSQDVPTIGTFRANAG